MLFTRSFYYSFLIYLNKHTSTTHTYTFLRVFTNETYAIACTHARTHIYTHTFARSHARTYTRIQTRTQTNTRTRVVLAEEDRVRYSRWFEWIFEKSAQNSLPSSVYLLFSSKRTRRRQVIRRWGSLVRVRMRVLSKRKTRKTESFRLLLQFSFSFSPRKNDEECEKKTEESRS